MYDEAGMCWCSCDGEGWSDTNILGRPSCVPVAAHLTYGWVGLLLSVSCLFHAAYHLHRQVNTHGRGVLKSRRSWFMIASQNAFRLGGVQRVEN